MRNKTSRNRRKSRRGGTIANLDRYLMNRPEINFRDRIVRASAILEHSKPPKDLIVYLRKLRENYQIPRAEVYAMNEEMDRYPEKIESYEQEAQELINGYQGEHT
jgi:hypothetical protein